MEMNRSFVNLPPSGVCAISLILIAMKNNRTFEERGWNHSLDLPQFLRRGLSGIFIMNKFPGEEKGKPTAMEDCPDCVVRGWLNRGNDEAMSRNCLSILIECYEKLFTHLYEEEKEMVNRAIEKRGDKPEITDQSIDFEIIDAVIWYCTMITLIADMFGICNPGTEAEIAYNERTERIKLKDNE